MYICSGTPVLMSLARWEPIADVADAVLGTGILGTPLHLSSHLTPPQTTPNLPAILSLKFSISEHNRAARKQLATKAARKSAPTTGGVKEAFSLPSWNRRSPVNSSHNLLSSNHFRLILNDRVNFLIF